ncbi:efflux RND transporter periplasmic adaptor subunit [Dysgonomonas macrotermitis]|nr:efflux RND transporter periplasmic adaptor subunit [Dysgonomonas macrotermitis]
MMEITESKPVDVKTRLLAYTDFNYELISNGIIESTRSADIRFLSQENIVKIHVKNGERVNKGQKLAEQDNFKLDNAMKQAVEAFEKSKLDLQDVLIGQGYSLRDSVNIPKDIMKIAKLRSNYEQSRNNYELAEYNLKATTLYAPFSGIVANLSVKEFNAPGSEPFCTIIDNHHIEVTFNILENELSLINLNDQVLVSPFSSHEYLERGRISEINPLIDKNGMVKVKAMLNSKENRLYEGMNVKVRVQRILGKQLCIPKSALVLRANKKVVFSIKNNKAKWNYVQTAQENTENYVITEGLALGDSIIYEGNINLSHDVPVIVKK